MTNEIRFEPTLFLFLGTSSGQIGWRLKDLLRRAYGDIPILRFLWVDADSTVDPLIASWFKPGERAELVGFNGDAVLSHLGNFPSIHAWWPRESRLKAGYINRGAGQMRPVGRLALFRMFNDRNSGPAFIDRLRQAAVQNAASDPGTVKPPPVVVPPITKPGTYPVGGVCTLLVEQLVSTDSLHAKLLPFDVLNGGRPQDTSRYLAGVCDLAYHVSGKLEPELPPGDGTVKICFAALPNITSKIYVYADKTWTALDTTLENGMECATASKTGRYVLAQSNP